MQISGRMEDARSRVVSGILAAMGVLWTTTSNQFETMRSSQDNVLRVMILILHDVTLCREHGMEIMKTCLLVERIYINLDIHIETFYLVYFRMGGDGVNFSKSLRGSFYLDTNNASPFGNIKNLLHSCICLIY